jgi:hypothetical protein
MPARRELEPRAMKQFIAYVNLVSVLRRDEDRCEYVVTLQCDHARDVVGNVQNRQLADVLSPAVERRWCGAFDLARANIKPVRLTTRASTLGRHWLACEIFLAPLGQEDNVEALFWVTVSWPATAGTAFPPHTEE